MNRFFVILLTGLAMLAYVNTASATRAETRLFMVSEGHALREICDAAAANKQLTGGRTSALQCARFYYLNTYRKEHPRASWDQFVRWSRKSLYPGMIIALPVQIETRLASDRSSGLPTVVAKPARQVVVMTKEAPAASGLQPQIVALQAEVGALKEKVTTQQTTIARAATDAKKFAADLDQARSELTALSQSAKQAIASLKRQLAESTWLPRTHPTMYATAMHVAAAADTVKAFVVTGHQYTTAHLEMHPIFVVFVVICLVLMVAIFLIPSPSRWRNQPEGARA
jgi:hypothetical protein